MSVLFLHAILTRPVPPGKSLLSLLATPDTHSANSLHTHIARIAHRAFWAEAVHALAIPEPATQIPRLAHLYLDLRDALLPLLPKDHPLLHLLASPLPPTSSPLLSTIEVLKDILAALRQRCAPIRDSHIDDILRPFTRPLPHLTPVLADLVVTTMRDTIAFIDLMKSDLGSFALNSMSESQLRDTLFQDVRLRERAFVHESWPAASQSWHTWLGSNSLHWVAKLFQALASDKPVACPNPSTSDDLPPQLYFIVPALIYIQNYIQATIIAAALRSLTRPPPTPTPESGFMHRIWALLKSEIDADDPQVHLAVLEEECTTTAAVPGTPTKLANLADEVVRARNVHHPQVPLSGEDEIRLREAVERTLRSTDPVYLLLKSRLLGALERDLLSPAAVPIASEGSGIPLEMHTGRAVGVSVEDRLRWRSVVPDPPSIAHLKAVEIEILGFEDPVLRSAIVDVRTRLAVNIAWTEAVWDDDLGTT